MKAIFGMVMAVCVALAGCGNPFSPPAEQSQPAAKNTPAKQPLEKVRATKDTVGTKGKGYGGGPITTPVSQYWKLQDRIALLNIERGLKDYHALHQKYPKSLEEFKQKIAKRYGVKLPLLPQGHSYSFDSEKGVLMVNRPRK